MSFYSSLKEGIWLPSWAAELNATYGNPLFIFNYSFSYYIISFFHFIGVSFISSMKVYLALTFFFSGIFMYLWINTLTKNKLAAFTSAIFYLFTPYHLIDAHFRATPGESTIFTFVPLLFFFITKYFQEQKLIYLILLSTFTIIMFLAHPLLSFVFIVILSVYIIFIGKITSRYKLIFLNLFFLLIGVLGSIYTWITFFIYKPYMFPIPTNELSFAPFWKLFFSPWRYGLLFQGPYGELALIIGYTQLIIIVIACFLLIKKKVTPSIQLHLSFWILIFFFFLFLMHPLSNIIWQFSSNLWMLVPFGRLLLPTAIFTSVIAGYVAIYFSKSKFRKKILYIIIVVTILSTALNWGHRRVIPDINDSVLRQGVWKSTVNEGITAYFLNNKWADKNNFWFSELPKQHLEIVKGEGIIREIKRTSIHHAYIIFAKTPITIKENTLYFPGWSLKSNDKTINIYPGKRGVINAQLPNGLQYVELTYDDFLPYKIAKIISTTIFSALLFILLINRLWQFKVARKK